MTEKQWHVYSLSKSCPECGEEYVPISNPKVRDHDHWTGEYRGPLCAKCNFRNRKNKFIPVFFHNLKGYDSHLILESLDQETINKSEIKIIPSNSGKYMSCSYIRKRNEKSKLTYEIRFLDSFAFMSSSLDSLSKNLPEDKFIISKNYYNREATISGGNQNDEIFKLMKRKGVYPYIDSFEKI